MSSEICPICEKTVSNLLQHIVLVHNIKDPEELRTIASPRKRLSELDVAPVDTSIDWNTEFYKILLRIKSEKRILFIEKELDELLDLVGRVENSALFDFGRNVLSNLYAENNEILEKRAKLLNAFPR